MILKSVIDHLNIRKPPKIGEGGGGGGERGEKGAIIHVDVFRSVSGVC